MINSDNSIIEKTDGDNKTAGSVAQAYCPLADINGYRPMIGSWMVGGICAGIGIRENKDNLITTNTSRFISHFYMP